MRGVAETQIQVCWLFGQGPLHCRMLPASPRGHHCSASTQEDGVAVADLGKTSWDS